MIQIAVLVGAVIRWLLKACKTSLKDEINGNYEATWGKSYMFENYLIGVLFAIILVGIVIIIFFV